MDAKLKALKVVDLKDILAKAAVAVPTKANKSDLINRIIANPKALQIYNAQFSPSKPSTPPPQNDDLLAPPEDVDWNSDGAEPQDPKQVKTVKSSPTAPIPVKQAAKPIPSVVAKPATAPSTNTTAPVNPSDNIKTAEDEELEKRKQRAARFGVPLVEPPKSRPTPAKKPSSHRVASTQRVVAPDDPEKLVARSARFGAAVLPPPPPPKGSRKRPASTEQVDAEELERRKKRAERFNIKPVGTKA